MQLYIVGHLQGGGIILEIQTFNWLENTWNMPQSVSYNITYSFHKGDEENIPICKHLSKLARVRKI